MILPISGDHFDAHVLRQLSNPRSPHEGELAVVEDDPELGRVLDRDPAVLVVDEAVVPQREGRAERIASYREAEVLVQRDHVVGELAQELLLHRVLENWRIDDADEGQSAQLGIDHDRRVEVIDNDDMNLEVVRDVAPVKEYLLELHVHVVDRALDDHLRVVHEVAQLSRVSESSVYLLR